MLHRILRTLLAVLVACATIVSIEVVLSGPAAAATCQAVGSGLNRHQYCSGIRNEVLSSKFTKGTASYYNGKTQNVDASIYFNGLLTDKQADGRCTYVRFVATNSYWPDGNVVTSKDLRVCGKGTHKVIGFTIDQAYTYPGTKVQIQHCWAPQGGKGTYCTTMYQRTIPQ